jgi:hypothetical protein
MRETSYERLVGLNTNRLHGPTSRVAVHQDSTDILWMAICATCNKIERWVLIEDRDAWAVIHHDQTSHNVHLLIELVGRDNRG